MVMLNDIDCCLDILLYCLSLYRKDLSTSEGKCYYWFDKDRNNMCDPSWQWWSHLDDDLVMNPMLIFYSHFIL